MLVELRACGTALDGVDLVPSYLHGVSLAPWLRYHSMQSYIGIDLASAEVKGPPSGMAAVPAGGSGRRSPAE